MLYTLNTYSFIFQLYLCKAGKKIKYETQRKVNFWSKFCTTSRSGKLLKPFKWRTLYLCIFSLFHSSPSLHVTNFMFVECMGSEKWKHVWQLGELSSVLLTVVASIMASWFSRNVAHKGLLIRYTCQASCCSHRTRAVLLKHLVGCAYPRGTKGMTWVLSSRWQLGPKTEIPGLYPMKTIKFSLFLMRTQLPFHSDHHLPSARWQGVWTTLILLLEKQV